MEDSPWFGAVHVKLLAQAAVRALLWLVIAFPATWATLWAFGRLLFAGVFGLQVADSLWFYMAWILVALVAGNAAAYGCDRVFVRHRSRSRPLGPAAES